MNGKGVVRSVGWDSPAFKAGLAPGATLVEVGGEQFSIERLAAAVSRRDPAGIVLTVELDRQKRAVTVVYDGGLRYPSLERIPGQADRLKGLLQPR